MYNRTGFLLKKKSDSERERWVAQQQQLKKKKEREKKVETSPPFIMRCVLLWHFPTLFYIYTHVATQSSYIRRYMYVRLLWCIYIYKHRERESQRWSGDGRRVIVAVAAPTITHFNRIIHQTFKRHHAVTSSLYHWRRVYDDQTIGFRWQIIAPTVQCASV